MISTGSTVGTSYLALVADEQLAAGLLRDSGPGGRRIELSGWRGDLLKSCRRFAPRAQLARFTDAQIGELERLGLVISDATVFSECAALESETDARPIDDLGIVTCASPDMLTRSIRAWNELLRRHGRACRLIVIDDSGTPAEAEAQLATAASLADATGADLRFAGPERRRAIASEIAARAGLDPELVNFAFDGRRPPRNGIGGSRNLLALLLQGRCVMSADDDVVAEFARPRSAELDLWITSGEARMELIPFDSPEQTRAAVALSNRDDPLATHERFVGQSVASLVRELEGHGSLFEASADLGRAIATRSMTVAVTASGLAGDCGSDCQAFFTLLGTSPETQQHILTHGDRLHDSREVLRRARFPVVCNANSLMTFCYAFDNALPLPPFFPVGRGEDQAWQALLHHTLPETLIAHLPIAAAHRPAKHRAFSAGDYMDPCRAFPANAYIVWAIGEFAAGGGGGRTAAVGARFSELAADPAGFVNSVDEAWQGYVDHHLQLIGLSPGMTPDAPTWWRRRLSKIRDELDMKRRSGTPAPLVYASLHGAGAVEAFRSDFGQYGELLQAWTGVREAAAAMSERLKEDSDWLSP